MKHPRSNDGKDTSSLLLGSDHSKKRQRTMSDASESSSIENKSRYGNVTKKNIDEPSSRDESSNYSPRMMALLSSLEALEDHEQRQIQQQWPLGSNNTQPLAASATSTTTTTQAAAAALVRQKQQPQSQPQALCQPLIARPAIHKIEEHPAPSTAPKALHFPTTGTSTPVEAYPDARNPSPALVAMDTIQRAVAEVGNHMAATTAATSNTYTAVNAALEQHRLVGAAALAAVSQPPQASALIKAHNHLQLSSFAFPDTAKHHHQQQLPHHVATARQLAIHNAVHSDYKKIYKPLKRPPRLPTPHEALVIAAIATPAR